MKRFARLTCLVTTLPALGGCLPDNFFQNLLGSSIASVAGALLSDILNTFLPPV